MTPPFIASIRARPGTIRVGNLGADALTIRVQLAEAWDTVRVQAAGSESIESVKVRALEVLDPSAGFHGEYAITYRGIKILDETESLSAAGIVNGATLLIEHRHRRPVR